MGTNDHSVSIYELILRYNSERRFLQSWAPLDFSFGVILGAAKKIPGDEDYDFNGSALEPDYEKKPIENMGSTF